MRILITGGSSEIGMAIAERQAKLGHEVVVTASSSKSVAELRPAYQSQKIPVFVVPFDLASTNTYSPELDEFITEGIDAVVLNAATQVEDLKYFHEFTAEDVAKSVEENVLGNVCLINRLLPGMISQRFGRLVFVSSISATAGTTRQGLYSLTKSAIEGLFFNLAVDYGRYNILSNIARPGIIRTERTRRFWERDMYEERIGKIIPQGIMGEPAQFAEALDPLLSETSYINGTVINVSGGLPLIRSEML